MNQEARRRAASEIFDSSRAARREQGRIRAASGQAGLALTGSVDALLYDSAMRAELDHSRSLANQESRQAANVAQAGSMYSHVRNVNALSAGLGAWAGIENAKIQKEQASRLAGRG